MKKRICTIVATILCMALLLVGCGAKSADAGVWDGNVFTNEWSNLKITVPEGSQIFTKDEMTSSVTGVPSAYFNDGTSGEKGLSKYANIYDCMITLPEGFMVQLMYENNAKTTAGKDIKEDNYASILKEQLAPLGLTGGEISTKEFAGRTFTYLPTSGNGLSADYYLAKEGSYMIILAVTYPEGSKETVDSFVSGITAAK